MRVEWLFARSRSIPALDGASVVKRRLGKGEAATQFLQDEAGIFTWGMPLRIILCRRATRRGFTCGLKTVRGLGIIADRKAASLALKADAGLWK